MPARPFTAQTTWRSASWWALAPDRREVLARYLPAAVVLVAGVALSLIAFFYVAKLERARLAAEFEARATQPIFAIRERVYAVVGSVQSLVAFYDSSRHVERTEFQTFAASILARHPALKALAWAPRVAASERAAYERRARQAGRPGFRFTELGEQGRFVPAKPRAEYFPVYYVAPYEANEAALGFDLASESSRRETLEAARVGRDTRVSAPLARLQGLDDQPAVLVMAPVYNDGRLRSVKPARADAVAGFVLVAFTVRDVVEGAMSPSRSDDEVTGRFAIQIYDRALGHPNGLLYASDPNIDAGAAAMTIRSGLHADQTFDVAGREWRIVVSPAAKFSELRHMWLPWAILSLGLACTACAAPTYHLRRQGNARLDQLARSLNEKNQTLERLSTQLSKYLPAQVCQAILRGRHDHAIAAKRKKLTVFVSDIKDFAVATADLEPEDLTFLLNDYFTEMSAIAVAHGATIDKFVGDAMLMFFGDPESSGAQEDALACVRMAVAMQRRMVDLRAKWRDLGYRWPIHVRIGINTGYCNVGNFGSIERMDYTVIGAEVNVAARMEKIAELDGITLTGETYALVKDHFDARAGEPVQLKGIGREIRPYAVVGIYDETDADRSVVRSECEGLRVFVDLSKVDARQCGEVARQLQEVASRLHRGHARP